MTIKTHNDDCFTILKDIPDKSANLVLTDPPYNIRKADWDVIPDYVEWCGQWLMESQRILKDNGSLYFFHSDFLQMIKLVNWIQHNTDFTYRSLIIWVKPKSRVFSWKKPTEKSVLRTFFPICEYILYFVKGETVETAHHRIITDKNNFKTLKEYFQNMLEYLKVNEKCISQKTGRSSCTCFKYKSAAWRMPSPELYQDLIHSFKINNWQEFRTFDDLTKEYNEYLERYSDLMIQYEKNRHTHHLLENHNNIWVSQEKWIDTRLHPTIKPVDILERIINVSSNPGETILDMFMGSGSTGVACVRTKRNFIGIEKDPVYFEIANKRIQDERLKQ